MRSLNLPPRSLVRGSDEIAIAVTREELRLINNALNEVCNGIAIEEWEFATRLGVGLDEARAVLEHVRDVLDGTPPSM